ncbi:MAG TPA: POTRA domain-containing protein [Pseudolabrys sp.]|nr:POTRA domain-containing protein [Pseudolabrys sp.]
MTRFLANVQDVIPKPRRSSSGAIALQTLTLMLALGGSAWAQQPAPQPRYNNQQQIERSFEILQGDQRLRAKPDVRLPNIPKPEVRASTKPLFKLRSVAVEGASTLSNEAIAETYTPYVGKTVSQADLVAIADAITELYRTTGYVLSRAIVPPQGIKNGRIRVKVIEGHIAELVLKGEGADKFGVRKLLARITEERPTQLKTLERQLLLANDTPGVRVADAAFEEIGKASGKFRLIVSIQTWNIYAALGFDNQATSAVGPLEAFATAGFNSYLVPGDVLNLNASTTPASMREFRYGQISYSAPIGTDGVRLGYNILYSNVAPGDARQQVNDHTQTMTYEAKGSFVPWETRKGSLWLTGIFGYSDSSERDDFSGMIYNDHLRYLSLTADFKLQDNFSGWNYLSVTGRQGLGIMGASRRDDDFLSRFGASGNFSLMNFAFARVQPLSDVFSAKISATGQWASGPLLISQQFYLGDSAYGPGFYSGDSGVAVYGELRFDQAISKGILKGYQLYGYFDKGAVWSFNNDGQILSIASAGAGIRFFLVDDWLAGLGFATPVHAGTTANDVHATRFLFTLAKSLKLCPQQPQMRCL